MKSYNSILHVWWWVRCVCWGGMCVWGAANVLGPGSWLGMGRGRMVLGVDAAEFSWAIWYKCKVQVQSFHSLDCGCPRGTPRGANSHLLLPKATHTIFLTAPALHPLMALSHLAPATAHSFPVELPSTHSAAYRGLLIALGSWVSRGKLRAQTGAKAPCAGREAAQLQLPLCLAGYVEPGTWPHGCCHLPELPGAKSKDRRRGHWRQGEVSSTWVTAAAVETAPLGSCMCWPGWEPELEQGCWQEHGTGCPKWKQVGLGPIKSTAGATIGQIRWISMPDLACEPCFAHPCSIVSA